MIRRLLRVAMVVAALALISIVTAAAASEGTPWAWGNNSDGELGNGTRTPYDGDATPGPVANLTDVIQITGGNAHSLALDSHGTVWAWGNGGWGQLGQGEYGESATPVKVPGLGFATAIAAGWAHSLALQVDGTVWAWGYNIYGQVGNGTSGNNVLSPTQVVGLSGVVAVAAGSGAFTSMALKSDGTVWAWGYDGLGQLGNGTSNEQPHPVPVLVANLANVRAIAGGGDHALAVLSDGTAWAWGSNTLGQLGAPTAMRCSVYRYPCSRVPVQVQNLTGVTSVAGGTAFSLALRSDGTVWGWGDNGYGQLGNGTVTLFGGVRTPTRARLANIVAIAAGDTHSLALGSDGFVRAAGENDLGQLGNGTFSDSSSPVRVLSVSGAAAVGAGQHHSFAVATAP